jgi:hypothetical protein
MATKAMLSEVPELNAAVHGDHYIIVPLHTPNEPGSLFLVAKTSSRRIGCQLPSLINNAEKIRVDATIDAFIDLIAQNQEEGKSLLTKFQVLRAISRDLDCYCASDPGDVFLKQSLVGIGSAVKRVIKGKKRATAEEKDKAAKRKEEAKKTQKLYEDFIKNCKEFGKLDSAVEDTPAYRQKRAEILRALKVVLKDAYSVTYAYEDFAKYLYRTENTLSETYDNMFNKYAIANKSKVKIGVENSSSIDRKNKNDGYIRLYVEADGKKSWLHFSRKPTFVVFLIYLLDRYHDDTEANVIDISEFADIFRAIFEMAYHESGDIEFDNLTKKVVRGVQRPVKLADCITDIKNVMGKTFEALHMSSERLPFIITNADSHLTVRKRNIILTPELLALFENWPD